MQKIPFAGLRTPAAQVATLSISRDKQDENSQRLGIVQYANDQGITPLDFIAESASRSQPWTEHEFGKMLLEQCGEEVKRIW